MLRIELNGYFDIFPPNLEGAQIIFFSVGKHVRLRGDVADMIDFTARQFSIISVIKINPTTELTLFLGRVTILSFIYIYGKIGVTVLCLNRRKVRKSNNNQLESRLMI